MSGGLKWYKEFLCVKCEISDVTPPKCFYRGTGVSLLTRSISTSAPIVLCNTILSRVIFIKPNETCSFFFWKNIFFLQTLNTELSALFCYFSAFAKKTRRIIDCQPTGLSLVPGCLAVNATTKLSNCDYQSYHAMTNWLRERFNIL